MDAASNVSLADYTWLPAELHQAFQSTLEKDDGIAALHFVAAIDKMARGKYQSRVLIASARHLYLCTPQCDIARCVALPAIEEVFTSDEWVCLSIPREYDLVFRISPQNTNANANQRFLFAVLNGLRRSLGLGALPVKAVASLAALAARPIDRPPGFRDNAPAPIPVLDWGTLATRVDRSDVLIQALLPARAERCRALAPPRPLPPPPPQSPPMPPSPQQQHPRSTGAFSHAAASAVTNAATTRGSAAGPSSPPHLALTHAPVVVSAAAWGDDGADRTEGKPKPVRLAGGTHAPPPPPPPAASPRRAALAALRLPPFDYRPAPPFHATPTASSLRSKETGHAASSPARVAAAAGASSPRFGDPCLELVWGELMAQRRAVEALAAQVSALVAAQFPHAASVAASVASVLPAGRTEHHFRQAPGLAGSAADGFYDAARPAAHADPSAQNEGATGGAAAPHGQLFNNSSSHSNKHDEDHSDAEADDPVAGPHGGASARHPAPRAATRVAGSAVVGASPGAHRLRHGRHAARVSPRDRVAAVVLATGAGAPTAFGLGGHSNGDSGNGDEPRNRNGPIFSATAASYEGMTPFQRHLAGHTAQAANGRFVDNGVPARLPGSAAGVGYAHSAGAVVSPPERAPRPVLGVSDFVPDRGASHLRATNATRQGTLGARAQASRVNSSAVATARR